MVLTKLKKISFVTYKVKLSDYCLIHNVFHVSMLKKLKGEVHLEAIRSFPELSVNNEPVVYPEELLERRLLLSKGKNIEEVRVQ